MLVLKRVLITLCIITNSVLAETVKVQPVGFFAMAGLHAPDQVKKNLLSLPYVNGITSYVSWKEIEPTQGQFNFKKLNDDIALAKSFGKKISFGVFTGKNSIPTWANQAGIKTWVTARGVRLIYPTDQTFIGLWKERVKMLGKLYDEDETVVQVTICGPTGALCGPRYPELPANVTLDALVVSWSSIIDAYNSAFPKTYKNLEVHLTTNGHKADLPIQLFSKIEGSVKIGPFAEFLSDTNPKLDSITGVAYKLISSKRDWCGFQMVSPLASKVGEAIKRGRSFGCNYFEIYPKDLQSQASLFSTP